MSKRVSAAAASVKSNSNSEIRSIGGIDGGEVAGVDQQDHAEVIAAVIA